MELGLFLVRGSKSTSVLCAGRKLLSFNTWIEIGLVFRVGIEIELVFVCGAKMTCFKCGDLLTWFLCGWSKLTWFLYSGRKSLGFSVNIELDLFFLCGWSN